MLAGLAHCLLYKISPIDPSVFIGEPKNKMTLIAG